MHVDVTAINMLQMNLTSLMNYNFLLLIFSQITNFNSWIKFSKVQWIFLTFAWNVNLSILALLLSCVIIHYKWPTLRNLIELGCLSLHTGISSASFSGHASPLSCFGIFKFGVTISHSGQQKLWTGSPRAIFKNQVSF